MELTVSSNHRSVHDALAKVHHTLCTTTCEFAVDMDIKSFFDEVSHSKLIKQLWTLGIHDKALLTIIKRMLKAGIIEPKFPKDWEESTTNPEKGTPQGGTLSPLLANIVLNELDNWIVNQWEEFKTTKEYTGKNAKGNKTVALKKTRLKVMRYVRYADDFRIFTDSYDSAKRIFTAVKMWLKERLKLEINEEKSQIVKLKQKNMKFLGITFKLVENPKIKQHKIDKPAAYFVPYTSVTEETYEKFKEDIRDRVIEIKYTFKHEDRLKAVLNYNAYIRGLSFYAVTSKWCKISSKLTWDTRNVIYNRLKRVYKIQKHGRVKDEEEPNKKKSGGFQRKRKEIKINGVKLLKPSDIKHEDIHQINPKICKYTKEGRSLVHAEKLVNTSHLHKHFTENFNVHETVEFNVNRLAALSAQKGLCGITGFPLVIGTTVTHHKKPVKPNKNGKIPKGTNKTSNLVLLHIAAHMLIHAVKPNIIKAYFEELKAFYLPIIRTLNEAAKARGQKPSVKWSDKSVLSKLNKYRLEAGYEKLTLKEIL